MGYVTVKYSVMEGSSTNQSKATSPITLTIRGKAYTWGANESKTLPDFVGDEAVAANNKLVITNRS